MKPRPLGGLLLLLVVPLIFGALLAPLAMTRIVPFLQRVAPGMDSLADAGFPRVLNRCVLLGVIVLLVPAIRMTGLFPAVKNALKLSAPRARTLAAAVATGLVSMALAYLAGWLMGGFRSSDDVKSGAALAARAALLLPGAVFIGIFEEVFFRGFVFGALRTKLGFAAAALAAGAFFMSVHFLKPELPADFDASRWYSGFAMFTHVGSAFDLERDGSFAVVLFLMGLTLCRLYETDGHLWRCAGLHGGWVWAMQTGAFALDRNWAIMRGALGPSDLIAQGGLAVPIVSAFLAWALWRSFKPGHS